MSRSASIRDLPAEFRRVIGAHELREIASLAEWMDAAGGAYLRSMIDATYVHEGDQVWTTVDLAAVQWCDRKTVLVSVNIDPRRCKVSFARSGAGLLASLGHVTENPRLGSFGMWHPVVLHTDGDGQEDHPSSLMRSKVMIAATRPDGTDGFALSMANYLGFPDDPEALQQIELEERSQKDARLQHATYLYRGETVRVRLSRTPGRWMISAISGWTPANFFRRRAWMHRQATRKANK